MTELDQPLWRIRRETVLYAPERRVPADIDVARQDFRSEARVLQDAMARPAYLVGEQFRGVDIVAAHALYWSTCHDQLGEFPDLEAYLANRLTREASPSALTCRPSGHLLRLWTASLPNLDHTGDRNRYGCAGIVGLVFVRAFGPHRLPGRTTRRLCPDRQPGHVCQQICHVVLDRAPPER